MTLTRKTLTRDEEWAEYWPKAKEQIRGRQVAWVASLPGFRWFDGTVFGRRADDDFHLLCVLWTAKHRGLIAVEGRRVLLTDKGAQR